MSDATIAILRGAFQLATAAIYAWVASIVLERRLTGDALRANRLFAVWWLGLGAVYLLSPAFTIPAALGLDDLAFTLTLLNAILILLCAALWGLVYYLVYLYTGKATAFWPITVAYAALAFGLLYLIAWMDPTGLDDNGVLQTQRALEGAPAIGLGLAISAPVVLAALAYGSLYFRTHDAAPRYRVGMVAGAFLFQFGWSLISTILQLSRRYPGSVALGVLGNVIGIVAALLIVMAYKPPAWVRARWSATEARGASDAGG